MLVYLESVSGRYENIGFVESHSGESKDHVMLATLIRFCRGNVETT